MPKYLDHHLTNALLLRVVEARAAGQPDDHAAIVLNLFVSHEQMWCLTEAPNAEALRLGHEALGIDLGPGDMAEVEVKP